MGMKRRGKPNGGERGQWCEGRQKEFTTERQRTYSQKKGERAKAEPGDQPVTNQSILTMNTVNDLTSDPFLTSGSSTTGTANTEIFSASELEELAYRRFNPLATLTAQSLSNALDGFSAGSLSAAARLWQEIVCRDETVAAVKAKREESIAQRDWTVVPLDDSSAAQDQAAALESFYRQVRAAHALNRHTAGGFPLLATQMMDAVSFAYAAHHLIWQPDAGRPLTLPSGRVVPALSATFEYVPLEFFEARTGELRFLGTNLGYNGEPLAPGQWMVTTGPGIMRSASIVHYYKRLAQHDLINFSEKFGTPGLVVHTTAQKDSSEGQSAAHLARGLAGNYRGVQYNAPENKVEIVWPQGGTAGGNLPMIGIIDECKRGLATLYLGADLSTLSRGTGAVGASIQGEERARRERADCARIEETLNVAIDPVVLRWFFGPDAPVLARFVLESPINEDRTLLGNLVQQLVNLGARVPVAEVARRLGVPVAKAGEEVFHEPTTPLQSIREPGPSAQAEAFNAEGGIGSGRD